MVDISTSLEYMAIENFYKDKRAGRSGLPYINHIDEGIDMLSHWLNDDILKASICARAYAIHPLIDEMTGILGGILDALGSTLPAGNTISLAIEHHILRNKFLVKDWDTHWDETGLQNLLGPMSNECAWMLLADKVQNQKDFRIHHWFTHEKTYQYEEYFNLWIETLRTYYL